MWGGGYIVGGRPACFGSFDVLSLAPVFVL
jgi:hypothetical protein